MAIGRSFQLERVTDLWAELEPLFVAHHAESGERLGPKKLSKSDYETYDKIGMLVFHTARVGGSLVGYCSTFLHRCPFDSQMEAHEDAIFILPEHRGFGQEFAAWIDTMHKTNGISRSYRERLIDEEHGERTLRRGPIGYTPHSVLFLRELVHG